MSSVAEHPDVALIRRHVEGAKDARRTLLERLAPLFRARVRLFLRGRRHRRIGVHDEDDLIQATWCKLTEDGSRRLRAFDPAHGVTLEGYVSVLVQNMLIDLTRTRDDRDVRVSLDVVKEIADPLHSPEARVIAGQELSALRSYLDRVLPEKGRLVARLLYEDGRTEDEAASMLNCTKQVIANWKHRIKSEALAFRAQTERGEKIPTGVARTSEGPAPEGKGGR